LRGALFQKTANASGCDFGPKESRELTLTPAP
jgi:hypothetical protein